MAVSSETKRAIYDDDLIIIQMRLDGFTNGQIADKFGLTDRAINMRFNRMRRKGLNVPYWNDYKGNNSALLVEVKPETKAVLTSKIAAKLLDIIVRDNMIPAILDGE